MTTEKLYRGWKIIGNTAWKSGTTIYGDSPRDVIRRINAFMQR